MIKQGADKLKLRAQQFVFLFFFERGIKQERKHKLRILGTRIRNFTEQTPSAGVERKNPRPQVHVQQ